MKNDSYVCEKLFLGTARPGRRKFISESIEMFHTSLGLRHGVQKHMFVVVCVLTTCYHAIKSFTKKNDACSSLKPTGSTRCAFFFIWLFILYIDYRKSELECVNWCPCMERPSWILGARTRDGAIHKSEEVCVHLVKGNHIKMHLSLHWRVANLQTNPVKHIHPAFLRNGVHR
jgi:hypothetical protein